MKNKTIKVLLFAFILFFILSINSSFASTDINFEDYTYLDISNFVLPNELKDSKYFCIIRRDYFDIFYTFDSTVDSFGLLEKTSFGISGLEIVPLDSNKNILDTKVLGRYIYQRNSSYNFNDFTLFDIIEKIDDTTTILLTKSHTTTTGMEFVTSNKTVYSNDLTTEVFQQPESIPEPVPVGQTFPEIVQKVNLEVITQTILKVLLKVAMMVVFLVGLLISLQLLWKQLKIS